MQATTQLPNCYLCNQPIGPSDALIQARKSRTEPLQDAHSECFTREATSPKNMMSTLKKLSKKKLLEYDAKKAAEREKATKKAAQGKAPKAVKGAKSVVKKKKAPKKATKPASKTAKRVVKK